jgi:putative phosphoesterase
MIQLAIISDIHANLIALDAVLKDIKNSGLTQIYCLGDLVDFAPWGNEVIDRIQEKNIPCLLGNHDQRIAFDEAIIPLPHHEISAPHKKWLATLPYNIELTFKLGTSFRKILLVHASLQSNDEYIHESTPKHALSTLLKQRAIDILVMGHTHHSYIQQDGDVFFINCGSVGRSKEKDRKATYTIITLSEKQINAEIVKVDYPISAVANAIYDSNIPDFYGDFLLANNTL